MGRWTREDWIDRAKRKWAGRPVRSVWNTTWEDLVTGPGNDYDGYPGADWDILGFVTGNDPLWWKLCRDIYIFDPVTDYEGGTQIGLPPDAVILDAHLRVYVQLKRYHGEKPTVNVYSAMPATPGTASAGDYTNIGSIPFATALLYDDVVEEDRNTFYLNADGIASISVLELINFGLRISFDVDNHEPPHYGSSVWEFGFLTSTSNVTAEKAELDLEYESSPLVRTYDAENVDIYSARLRGRLLLDGGLVCQGKFEYGKTLAFGKETSWQLATEENPSTNKGYFEADVADLEPDTLYYFRAVAENPMGINYGYGSGAYKTFTTLPGPPPVTRIKGGNMPNRLVAARAI